MPFSCPSCKADTTTLISRPDVDHLFCPLCRPEDKVRDKKLYTGKKCWGGHEVYNREQLREKAWNFEQASKQRVADEQKRMRPSLRKKLYGD